MVFSQTAPFPTLTVIIAAAIIVSRWFVAQGDLSQNPDAHAYAQEGSRDACCQALHGAILPKSNV
eukprot:10175745-Lingulodinium_polyedra.AAC.1